MTPTATRHRMKKNQPRHARELRAKARSRQPRVTSDRAIYGLTILVGFFFTVIASLLLEGHWREPLFIYIVGLAYLITATTWAIYRGRHLPNWQQAMARIPLRFAGYGTPQGKPLEAAHDQPNTRSAFLASAVISILIVIGLFLAMNPFNIL